MKPLYWIFSALSLPLGQATAYLVSPNGTAAPGSAEDCSNWVGYEKDMTCQMVEVLYEITAAEFEEWNPIVTEVSSSCSLVPDLYFCVEVEFIPNTYTSLPSGYSSDHTTTSESTSLPSTTGSVVSTTASTSTSTPASPAASISTSTTSNTSHSSSTSSFTAPSSVTSKSVGSVTAPVPIQTGLLSASITLLSSWIILSALALLVETGQQW